MKNDESSPRNLPSLHNEIYWADVEGRPVSEALVRRWATQAGFVVRKAPHSPSLSPGGATRFTVFDVSSVEYAEMVEDGVEQFDAEQFAAKQLDGVTLEEIAVYLTAYLREGCY
jgi:hypothetical protein